MRGGIMGVVKSACACGFLVVSDMMKGIHSIPRERLATAELSGLLAAQSFNCAIYTLCTIYVHYIYFVCTTYCT